MKNKIVFFLFITAVCQSQTAVYNKIKSGGNFKEYQTKQGETIKIGDTIKIGYPLGKDFTFLTQGNQPVAAFLSNNKVVVSNFKSIGSNNRGFKIYALFKGYGIPVYIDYESALETGEIKNPFE